MSAQRARLSAHKFVRGFSPFPRTLLEPGAPQIGYPA